VQSRVKMLQKMEIVEDVLCDPNVVFIFPTPDRISPPMLKLDEAVIGYSEDKIIINRVNMSID